MSGRYLTAEEAEKIFIRRIEQNRPNIELRWMVAERTTRAMWEESEGGLLFARIMPKHFLY